MTETEHGLFEDAVKLRSYFIWKREGCPHGREHDHWRRAWEELRIEHHAEPPPCKPMPFVMPRVPISTRPNKMVAARLSLKTAASKASAAMR